MRKNKTCPVCLEKEIKVRSKMCKSCSNKSRIDPGKGGRYLRTEEIRKKCGKYLRTEEIRSKSSASHKGKKHSEEAKQKISEGHKGKKHFEETKQKISESKKAERNPMWKGSNVGYAALHEWIKNRLDKPPLCSICGEKPPIDLANKSGEYKRDINDFEWLCRRCHMISDGRMVKLKTIRNNRLIRRVGI
jgi:hypothetical protein